MKTLYGHIRRAFSSLFCTWYNYSDSFYAELRRNGKVWLGFTGSVREVSYISVKNFRYLRVYYASYL